MRSTIPPSGRPSNLRMPQMPHMGGGHYTIRQCDSPSAGTGAASSAGSTSAHGRAAMRRGMSKLTDLIDRIGGTPYEFASAEALAAFVTARGFTVRRLAPNEHLG